MTTYTIGFKEAARLNALYDYDILDTITEEEYDNITKIAARICNTEASLITFLDRDRQWFKSHLGIDIQETPRSVSFCNYTIQDPTRVLVVPDMRLDERFSQNPLVVNSPHAVFYAGAPLVTPEGFALGSICVLHGSPKELTTEQTEALRGLAQQVVTRLELQKKIKSLKTAEQKLQKANKRLMGFADIVSHDMKTPLANILMMTKSFKKRYDAVLDESADGYLNLINDSTNELLLFIDNILHRSKKINNEQEKGADSSDVLARVIAMIAPPEDFKIMTSGKFPMVPVNQIVLQQIFQNLITNAIKYNDKDRGAIHISAETDDMFHHFEFEDNGTGIEECHLSEIFCDRKTLGQTDRFGNIGTGIGLAAVKNMIDELGGSISVQSQLNVGSVFNVSIPVKKIA
jgi:K+-sensing histidine kinase KdpD